MIQFILLTMILTPSAWAVSPDILGQSDDFLGRPGFQDAFHAGEVAEFEQHDCLSASGVGPCDTMRSKVESQVDSARREAKLSYFNSAGALTREDTISQRDWEAVLGNRLRIEILSLENASFKVTLEKSEMTEAHVNIDGRSAVLPVMRTFLTAKNLAGISITETVDLAKGLPGMAQLVKKEKVTSGLFSGTEVIEVKAVHTGH